MAMVIRRFDGLRRAQLVGLVISALAMLVALLSLGLLAPTVVAAAIAPVVTRLGAHTHVRQREELQQSQERGVAR